jgi:rod shape-determining protein MreD
MRKQLLLYVLIFVSVLLQVFVLRYAPAFPDIILLLVVFSGIFFGVAGGLSAGFVAGFLRGCFSVGTFPADLFIFPIVGYISSMLSFLFYKRNPAFQVFAAAVGMFLVVFFHTLYFNATGGALSLSSVLLKSWKYLAVTIFLSPFIFAILGSLLQIEE